MPLLAGVLHGGWLPAAIGAKRVVAVVVVLEEVVLGAVVCGLGHVGGIVRGASIGFHVVDFDQLLRTGCPRSRCW